MKDKQWKKQFRKAKTGAIFRNRGTTELGLTNKYKYTKRRINNAGDQANEKETEI